MLVYIGPYLSYAKAQANQTLPDLSNECISGSPYIALLREIIRKELRTYPPSFLYITVDLAYLY